MRQIYRNNNLSKLKLNWGKKYYHIAIIYTFYLHLSSVIINKHKQHLQ